MLLYLITAKNPLNLTSGNEKKPNPVNHAAQEFFTFEREKISAREGKILNICKFTVQ
jgi:hypothetical protein